MDPGRRLARPGRRIATCSLVAGMAFAAMLACPAATRADNCALVPDGWIADHVGQIVEARAMTVLLVTRFKAASPADVPTAEAQRWADDVPSSTLGDSTICDAVQLESPVPLDQPSDRPLIMMQGERLPSGFNLPFRSPALAARIAADGRHVNVPAGQVYVYQVQNFDDMEWRSKVLREAARAGEIDRNRWMVGLPGALYLVPIRQ